LGDDCGFRERHETTQRVVHGNRITEHGSNVRVKKDDVGALPVALVVFAAYRSGEVVFGEVVAFSMLSATTHTPCSLWRGAS
jgi:hypothetical protein